MHANTMTKKLEIVKRVRDRSYQVNGITYIVTPRYLDEGEQNVKTRFERIIKNNGAIVLFGKQPFTSLLISSNLNLFKYEIIWDKVCASNPMLAKKQPLQKHENICVFYKKQPTYNPQMVKGKQWHRGGNTKTKSIHTEAPLSVGKRKSDESEMKYPKSIISYSTADRTKKLLHPTQKNVNLLEWLIKTYTNENEIVLDNCMGSGSAGVACINTNRKFIGIEKEEKYFEIAKERIDKHVENIKQ